MDFYDLILAKKLGGGGGGGGSSGISLLNTITVSEDVRAVSVDLSAYSSYDMLIIFEDLELTGSEYLFYLDNGTEPSGGSYGPGASVNHKGWCGYVFNMPPINTRRYGKLAFSNFGGFNGPMNNLYIYTEHAANLIKAGSVLKIYGGNYADL